MLLWGELLSSSVEICFLAVRSHEDGEFSVNDFRCLWAVYRHEELLPEDLADMIRRVSGGPGEQRLFTDACLSKMTLDVWRKIAFFRGT